MKTVLITGGAGFIGSHLADKLLSLDYRVICIDNLDKFYPQSFKLENIREAKKNKNYFFYNFDIQNNNNLTRVFRKHPGLYSVVHLAAKAGVRPSIEKPVLYEKINIGGTYKLLGIVSQLKIRQFVFASSSSIYGNAKVPFSEEDKLISPLSPYGATKLAGEQACCVFHRLFGIPVTILRFFSVYGPRGRPDMAPYLFTEKAYLNKQIKQFGDGNSARDWTYIDDIVDGIVKVIKHPSDYEVINLGGNKPVRLITLLQTIEHLTAKKLKKSIFPLRLEEPKITYADISKAKKILGWKPKTGFEKGMQKFIKWYKEKRAGKT